MHLTNADRFFRRLVHAGLLSAALTLGAGGASAQSDKAQAEVLFQEGRTLMKQGSYDQACPKFADSMRLDPSSGAQMNLGQCYEAQGKTASAWGEYRAAAALARNQNRADNEAKANALATQIEPKLSRLKIDAPPDVAGLVVKRDGSEVVKSSLGVAVPADPGEHTIVASAPGYKDWSTKVTLGKDADSKTVTIPALEKGPEGAAPVPVPGATPSSATGAPPPTDAGAPPSTTSTNPVRIAGFVVGGVGVAGIAVGAIFGALASGDASDAEKDPNLCGPEKLCTEEGRKVVDKAETKALVSTIGIGVGAAALAAGVILVVIGKPVRKEAGTLPLHARFVPDAAPGRIGATFVGGF